MTYRVHTLTSGEIAALQHLHRSTKDAHVRSRCDMILWSNEGLSAPQISHRVRYSRETVVRHIKRYEAEGIKGVLNKPRPGRPPRVTPAYLQHLEECVDQQPRDMGLTFSNWTTENLASYMAEQTGIQIGARQMENYLKAQRWRLRRPVRTIKHHQDPLQVAEKKTAAALLPAGPE